jgi:hypothetical protein
VDGVVADGLRALERGLVAAGVGGPARLVGGRGNRHCQDRSDADRDAAHGRPPVLSL